MQRILNGLVLLSGLPFGACAIQYYDSATQTQHIFGIGHIAYRTTGPAEGPQAVVVGTDIFGVGLGTTASTSGLTLGYASERRAEIFKRNASLTLAVPGSDLLDLKVGSEALATP